MKIFTMISLFFLERELADVQKSSAWMGYKEFTTPSGKAVAKRIQELREKIAAKRERL